MTAIRQVFRAPSRFRGRALSCYQNSASLRINISSPINFPDNLIPTVELHLKKHGLDNTSFTSLRLSSSACVAFPTCGLAMADSERYLPILITKLESRLGETGSGYHGQRLDKLYRASIMEDEILEIMKGLLTRYLKERNEARGSVIGLSEWVLLSRQRKGNGFMKRSREKNQMKNERPIMHH